MKRKLFTGVEYAWPRQQPWVVRYCGDIIWFAFSEAEAHAKLNDFKRKRGWFDRGVL